MLAVYFFGSDAMVEALAAHKASFHDETLQDNCHKNVAWLYDHALKNCTAAARRPVATGAASQEVRVTRTTAHTLRWQDGKADPSVKRCPERGIVTRCAAMKDEMAGAR